MWQATEMLVEAMGVMRVFMDDIRESGKGKDANYTVG